MRSQRQVSELFHTKPFNWDEVAKACYQTLAVRWEDEPPSAAAAWGATAICLLPAVAMLVWGRGGLRLIGLCVLVTFDGAICASIGDRNVIQSRYFVFANALLLCGLPPLIVGRREMCLDNCNLPAALPRGRFGLVSAVAMGALVVGMGWLCLAHAERRERYARRPGMMGAMEYVAESRQSNEPLVVCNPMLQITAAGSGGGWPSQAVNNVISTRRARKLILPVYVLSKSMAFPHFQGTAVMRAEEYLSPEALARDGVQRLWAIDAVDWIAPEWKAVLPRNWVQVSEVAFPEWAQAENCQIIVRCYQRRRVRSE
jgi:hypothetical protein